jgi:general secretion pathway protein G
MYQNSIIRAKEAILKEDLFQIRDAIDKYYADQGEYPPDISSLVDKKYIRGIPQDPFTGSDDSWIVVASEDGVGVFDLHSGSDVVGRNGVVYSEW